MSYNRRQPAQVREFSNEPDTLGLSPHDAPRLMTDSSQACIFQDGRRVQPCELCTSHPLVQTDTRRRDRQERGEGTECVTGDTVGGGEERREEASEVPIRRFAFF